MASADHIPGSKDSGAWPLEIRPQPAVTEPRGVGGWGVEAGSGPRSLKGLEKDEVPCTEEQSRGGTPLGVVTHTALQLRREQPKRAGAEAESPSWGTWRRAGTRHGALGREGLRQEPRKGHILALSHVQRHWNL